MFVKKLYNNFLRTHSGLYSGHVIVFSLSPSLLLSSPTYEQTITLLSGELPAAVGAAPPTDNCLRRMDQLQLPTVHSAAQAG